MANPNIFYTVYQQTFLSLTLRCTPRHLDKRLNWTTQISEHSTNVSWVSYLFWKLRDTVSVSYLRTVNLALIQSHLFHGLIILDLLPLV